MPNANLVLAQEAVITWAAAITGLGVLVAAGWKPVKNILIFLELWNGKDPIKDAQGNTIRKGKLGVPALLKKVSEDLDEVRSQVQNHHSTNLRDDLDKLQGSVSQINTKVSEHIAISKQKEGEQEATARKLDEHINQTAEYIPKIQKLYDQWGDKKRRPPDE